MMNGNNHNVISILFFFFLKIALLVCFSLSMDGADAGIRMLSTNIA